ncbi:unnamed protein product [Trichogramma brassicae]|uniref:Uncharacterized protein n=1 Tax=Trichogramma brassicae TaxID=86971 RepID=A0A6H5I1F8_9HYME|nr:unnamed protein product [Trichogramma brassicae]
MNNQQTSAAVGQKLSSFRLPPRRKLIKQRPRKADEEHVQQSDPRNRSEGIKTSRLRYAAKVSFSRVPRPANKGLASRHLPRGGSHAAKETSKWPSSRPSELEKRMAAHIIPDTPRSTIPPRGGLSRSREPAMESPCLLPQRRSRDHVPRAARIPPFLPNLNLHRAYNNTYSTQSSDSIVEDARTSVNIMDLNRSPECRDSGLDTSRALRKIEDLTPAATRASYREERLQ